MSKTRGEGRSGAEKTQRVIEPAHVTKARREARRREQAGWESRSGPVVVTKKEDPNARRD